MKVKLTRPMNKVPGDKILAKIRNPEPIDTNISRDIFDSPLYNQILTHPSLRKTTVSSGHDNIPIQIGYVYGKQNIFDGTVLETLLEREFNSILPDGKMNVVLENARESGLRETMGLDAIDVNSKWEWYYYAKLYPPLVDLAHAGVTELELLKIDKFKLPSLALVIPFDLPNEYVDIGSKHNNKTAQAKAAVPVSQGTLLAFNQCCAAFHGIYTQMNGRRDIAFSRRNASSRLLVINAVKVHTANPDYPTILMNFGSSTLKADPAVLLTRPKLQQQPTAATNFPSAPAPTNARDSDSDDDN